MKTGKFFIDLYSSKSSRTTFIKSSNEHNNEAASITSDEVRGALQDRFQEKRLEKME